MHEVIYFHIKLICPKAVFYVWDDFVWVVDEIQVDLLYSFRFRGSSLIGANLK